MKKIEAPQTRRLEQLKKFYVDNYLAIVSTLICDAELRQINLHEKRYILQAIERIMRESRILSQFVNKISEKANAVESDGIKFMDIRCDTKGEMMGSRDGYSKVANKLVKEIIGRSNYSRQLMRLHNFLAKRGLDVNKTLPDEVIGYAIRLFNDYEKSHESNLEEIQTQSWRIEDLLESKHKEALRQIKNLKGQVRYWRAKEAWISVKKLPTKSGMYHVFCPHPSKGEPNVMLVRYDKRVKQFVFERYPDEITHWKPLPSDPRQV